MTLQVLLTLFLVLLNGFFVAAEFAIVKVRASQIEVKAGRNKNIQAAARSILNNLDGYLAATQLGITLASLGLGWVGERVMTDIVIRVSNNFFNTQLTHADAGPIAIGIAFFIITVLHIVFGELAPKSLAIRYPAKTTFALSLPLRIFYLVFRPFIWLLNGMANMLLRMFGLRPTHGSDIHSEEELKMIITESHEGGAIEQSERELIQNVFDFDDRRVWDIQRQRKDIAAIPMSCSPREAFNITLEEGYSRYPIYAESIDDIRGILHTKDLMKMMLAENPPDNLQSIIRPPYFISGSRKIGELLKDFQRKHVLMAVVTNEIGEVSGIVTMEDILEELVGEIQDEYDNEMPYVEQIGIDKFLVDAHQKIQDVNKYLPDRLEESEHYETLSGLISYVYPDEVKVGDVMHVEGYDVKVLKMYRNSIEQVEMKFVRPDEQEVGDKN